MLKNGKATEGRASIKKCGETPLEEGPCENVLGLSMCDGSIETVKCIWVNI